MELLATENVVNDLVDPEFDGHYADVVLTVVDSPAIPALTGWGLALLAAAIAGSAACAQRRGRRG